MEHFDTTSIMIDPSLILAANSAANTFALVEQFSSEADGFRFYYPSSLQKLTSQDRFDAKSPSCTFFLQNAHPSDPLRLSESIDALSSVLRPFELQPEYIDRYVGTHKGLTEELDYRGELHEEELRDVLFEEFVFLQEQSFVVSRIKKPFNRFISAGVVCVHFGGRAVDDLVRRTPHVVRQGEPIRDVDRLKAFGKWIAVGGLSATRLIEPAMTGVLVSMALAYFALFDPE